MILGFFDGARRGSRTLTPFRAADFESAASAISPPWPDGAGEGNRTLVTSLEGWRSTIELHPRQNADIVLLLQGHVKFDEKTRGTLRVASRQKDTVA